MESLTTFIDHLINLAFPGEVNVYRRVTIDQLSDKNVSSFTDEVCLENVGNNNAIDASGFYTYFNTFLHEIVMPNNFWEGNVAPPHYDDNLPFVRVTEVNQLDRLNRRIFILPVNELADPNANSIIYKDETTAGKPEVAIEYWRQKGDKFGYPEK